MLQDDLILPFEIKPLGVRGRVVRLGSLVDEIISKHDYPDNVSKLLAEAVALVALLGNSLKFEGKLTLQTRSDGPVAMIVADYTTPGQLRAYAHFDREAALDPANTGNLLGKGHLALTIDQGPDMDNYQGIVALSGDALADAAHTYFAQSEQIPTCVKLAAGQVSGDAEQGWRAGAIMVQHVPASGPASAIAFSSGDAPAGHDETIVESDDWVRARILTETTEDHELLDPMLAPERLLLRLFHEDGVTVYDKAGLKHQCTCSREKVIDMLTSFSAAERKDMLMDGQIEVVCQFCSNVHRFDETEVENL